MTKEQVRTMLLSKGFQIVEEKRTGNGLGTVYKLSTGCLINC